MPAVSLPPKENALFKRILVSARRRAGGCRRHRACHPSPRPGGRPPPAAGTPPPHSQSGRGNSPLPFRARGSRLGPRAGARSFPPLASPRLGGRARCRARPRAPRFSMPVFLLGREEAMPGPRQGGGQHGPEPQPRAGRGEAPWEGTGGADAAPLIHCPGASLPPSLSAVRPSLFLPSPDSPVPARPRVTAGPERREERAE